MKMKGDNVPILRGSPPVLYTLGFVPNLTFYLVDIQTVDIYVNNTLIGAVRQYHTSHCSAESLEGVRVN